MWRLCFSGTLPALHEGKESWKCSVSLQSRLLSVPSSRTALTSQCCSGPTSKNVSVPLLKFSYGLLGLFLRPFTSGPVLGMLDNLLVNWPLFCTAGISWAGGDGKVLVVQFNLTCPVSYLLECPGGSENPCNGHGTCLDGIQQNGTCICKVRAWFTLRVTCFVRGTCGVCRSSGWRLPFCLEGHLQLLSSQHQCLWFSCSIAVVSNSTKTLLVMVWSWEESRGWNKERIAFI